MSISRTWRIFSREVKMGPRTMMVIWLMVFPILITVLVRLVFGGLIDPSPRLGIVDFGNSEVTADIMEAGVIDLTLMDDIEQLKQMVENNDLDAGLVLERGFDAAVRGGELPELKLFLGGESLASNRIVLAVTMVDLIRGLAGNPAPVEVETVVIGEGPSVPIAQRLVPMLVLLSVAMAGIFLPAASIIQEKTHHTVDAVLLSPATVGDFMVAKAVIGFLLAFGMGVVTLVINGGFTEYVGGNLMVVAVGALMSVQIGLLMGAAVGDIQTMFTIWKGGGIILFAPAVLFMFPSLPGWIARLFPTYYFLGPLYEMTVNAAPVRDILLDLGIGVAISVALMFVVARSGRRMEQRLAVG